MEIKTKFEDGERVLFLLFGELQEGTIKSTEVRTMNNKAYIKYRMLDGSWKNEEDLQKI